MLDNDDQPDYRSGGPHMTKEQAQARIRELRDELKALGARARAAEQEELATTTETVEAKGERL